MKNHYQNNLLLQLNSIYTMAALENAPKTQKLIKQVIDGIRYRTKRIGQLLKLKEELDAVSKLLKMFKVRYADVLEYNIEVDEECLDLYIPHYMIMTFIENSLYHAFENKEYNWIINLKAEKKQETYMITISDNGTGFEDQANDSCPCTSEEYDSIASTVLRIKEYFGEKADIQIKSSKTQGTRVTILITG